MNRIWAFALLLALTACGGHQPAPPGMKIGKPYVINGETYYPEYDATYDKTGVASWYGPGFHGKYTANGEVFNQNDLTAAHPTLPMPSLVRVTNLENGKNIVVRINDRGPFKSSRIIDLSKKSAQSLGIHSLAKVRVQFLKSETEQYMAQRKDGGDIDMFAYNEQIERGREASLARSTEPEASEIVESTISSSGAGQTVTNAAPVMTVDSGDLDSKSSIKVSDTPAPVTLTKPGSVPSFIKEAAADDEIKVSQSNALPPRKVVVNDNETITEITENDAEQINAPADDLEPDAVTLQTPGKSQISVEKPKAPVKIAEPKKEKPSDLSPASGGSAGYFIQAGSFSAEENAHKLGGRLSSVSKVNVDQIDLGGKTWWRVRVGPFSDKSSADEKLAEVRANGVPDARIVHQ